MQNNFLHKKFWSRPNEEFLYHQGRIKITSPEQFVPLFLANYGKEPWSDKVPLTTIVPPKGDGNRFIYVTSSTRNSLVNVYNRVQDFEDTTKRGVYKQLVTEELKSVLNCPLPTEYSFIDPRGHQLGNWGTNLNIAFELFVSMNTYLAAVSQDYQVLAALGVLCDIKHVTRASQRSSLFPSFNYTLPNRAIIPQVVTLIKYKYLARARASLYLSTGMDIPHDAIKIVRTQTFMNGRIRNIFDTSIHPMITQTGMQLEYASQDVVRNYLFPPQVKKNKEQTIADAIKNLTEPEPHVVY